MHLSYSRIEYSISRCLLSLVSLSFAPFAYGIACTLFIIVLSNGRQERSLRTSGYGHNPEYLQGSEACSSYPALRQGDTFSSRRIENEKMVQWLGARISLALRTSMLSLTLTALAGLGAESPTTPMGIRGSSTPFGPGRRHVKVDFGGFWIAN